MYADKQQVQLKLLKSNSTIKAGFSALCQCNDAVEGGYSDMVKMSYLNEAEIINNIKQRYQSNTIFTYIGPTLIVVNPYKQLEGTFGTQKIDAIVEKAKQNVKFSLEDCEPHIYAISALAYRNVFKNKKQQAIVISGESGSGKTENAKYSMR